ncbi:MAG: bifunctional metallophosphatase/5'-nucleotidase, partial [Methanomicrobiales archaeon HGW-Methanomicrobiales-4]
MEYNTVLSGQARRLAWVFFLLLLFCGWGIISCSFAESVSSDNLSVSETPVNLTILALNDYHGQVSTGKMVNNTPVGSMGVLASYILQSINASGENHTIIALPGDMTGVSPPESGLLMDEPTLLYFNLFSGNTSGDRPYQPIASCPIVATVGNHEFDRSLSELNRKIYGGNGATTFSHLQDPYPGSDATVIASNILVTKTGKLFLPPYTIREVDGVSIAFIGAVTNTTPYIVALDNVKELTFLDEADSINQQVETLKNQGIHAFVILLHEGGSQDPYDGETRSDVPVTGRIVDIVSRLDSDVDVVLSGHTHEFTNAYLQNAGDRPVLVTQAYSYSKAFANVSLSLDPVSDDIIWKTASIVTPYADRSPGNSPNPEATRLLNDTFRITDPLVKGVISFTYMNITAGRNSDGESNLYDLVTDSMRVAMNSDIAVLNEGAVRADIYPGNITMGKAYEMLPFGNNIITVNMTGDQIQSLVEQQWNRTIRPDHMLQISGFNYTYDDTRSINNRVLSLSQNGTHIKPGQIYSVATVPFLAGGGDGYTVMKQARQGVTGLLDLDALVPYVKSLKTP